MCIELDSQCTRIEESLLLTAGMLDKAWNTLSGGERQRAAIACALIVACSVENSQRVATVSASSSTVQSPLPSNREDHQEEADETAVLESGSLSWTLPAGHIGSPNNNSSSNEEDNLGSVDNFPDAVLLLDEPTAACDPQTCLAVERALIVSGVAMIIITHDERQAERMAHRRLILTTQQQP